MVSRRNFFSIVVLLLIMIFMFMFSGVLKQELNDYGTNSYVESLEDVQRLRAEHDELTDQMAREARIITAGQTVSETRDKRVAFLSNAPNNDVGQTVKAWCTYAKHPMMTLSTFQGMENEELDGLPGIIVVDGIAVNWEKDARTLFALAANGSCVVFARMPVPSVVADNARLRSMMGIKDIYSENIAIDGVRLFPGFFVGNEESYQETSENEGRQDLDLVIPWYVIGEGSKTYMMGMVNDRTRKSEYLPALVWRYTCGQGKVFCINGDYVTKDTGIGFLTACLAEKDSYDLYPVINAQNLVLASYGGFTDENGDALEEIYDQRQIALFRDIVWPSLVSMEEKTDAKMSMMASLQLDYEDQNEPVKGQLIYYLRLLNEGYGEAGISTEQISSIPLREKMGKDRVYWESEALGYALQSAYLEKNEHYEVVKELLPDLRTVVVPAQDGMPVSYLDDVVTCQMTTSSALKHSFSDDLDLKAYETALGYSNVVLDMAQVSYPEEQDWADFSRNTSRNIITYWKQFSGFDQTTLSESDARIRRFFALDYKDEKKDQEISLHVDNFDQQAFFILKLNVGEIDEVKGAEITNLKHDFYLLSVQEADVTITLKQHKLSIQ